MAHTVRSQHRVDLSKEEIVALRDAMRSSAAPYLQPGESVQAVIGAQTASQYIAAISGIFVFLGLNRYRILAVTPTRIVVLDAGKVSWKKARSVVTVLPGCTRLGPATGIWHQIPVGNEKLRERRRFFKDIETARQRLTCGRAGPIHVSSVVMIRVALAFEHG
jgi:hypothetical protein